MHPTVCLLILLLIQCLMIELLPFQKIGSAFLQSKKFALLADDMGLGKTPEAIDAARYLQRVLVVCPAVAKYNWQNEFIKFAGRKSWVAGDGVTHYNKKTLIISFNYLVDYLEEYKKYRWDVIIIDEAHLLKEPTAQRTQAAFGKNGIIHYTKRLWALTGTPAPNHAGELWVLLYTFGYTKLSYQGFIARYCISHFVGGNRYSRAEITGTNTKNSPELKTLLKRMSLRRLKSQVLDLPPIFHNTYYIKGDDDAKILKQYPELKEKLRGELDRLKEQLNINIDVDDDKLISSLQFLGQSISSLRRYHGLKKIKETAELIDFELKSKHYDKLIVFGIHTDVLTTLQNMLLDKGHLSVIITGKTEPKHRQQAVEIFQTSKSVKIFFGNIQAAGVAITLTAATQIIFIEEDWVPGNNKQAADRAHRIGQKETINVRHIAIKDSLDAKITATLVRKIREISTFID